MFFRKKSTPPLLQLSQVEPLRNAFAHNDYAFNYPLLDALQLGFNFIEADVYCIKGKLLVYHNYPFFPNYNNTLTNLYLKPLYEIFNKNKGSIFPNSNRQFHLLIDFKSEAETTYKCLKKKLEPFAEMFCACENEKFKQGAVQIILSGNRPIQKVKEDKNRVVFLDGRMEDIGKYYPTEIMPIISQKYSKLLGWSFFSSIPSAQKLIKLKELTDHIHKEGKLFRLWAVPENELVWEILLKNGLDLICSDRIKLLSNFLNKK